MQKISSTSERLDHCVYKTWRMARSLMVSAHLLRSHTFVVNGKSIVFPDILRSSILRSIVLDGYESYEREMVALLKAYPFQVDVFVDGGANVGFFSVLAERYMPETTRILAVEPFSGNIAYLRKIKTMNRLSFELVECALDGADGVEREFYYPVSSNSSELSSSASLINQFRGSSGVFKYLDCRTERVKTVRLETLIQGCAGALVKLDIEGNELSVLKASRDMLLRDDVDLIIEMMIGDSDKDAVFQLLVGYGYRGYLITNAGLVREERPLTLPIPSRNDRTLWRNHFFTKRDEAVVRKLSMDVYGKWI